MPQKFLTGFRVAGFHEDELPFLRAHFAARAEDTAKRLRIMGVAHS
jgi:hypothetical protein